MLLVSSVILCVLEANLHYVDVAQTALFVSHHANPPSSTQVSLSMRNKRAEEGQ